MINKNDYLPVVDRTIFFRKAKNKDVSRIIKSLNPTKAPGSDKIRVKDIQLLGNKITCAITNLINVSVLKGKYPAGLKSGIVRPVYKKGERDQYSNYRPITLLPIIDKIVEKYIAAEIHQYYAKNDILTNTQFGFQPNKSTSLLLTDFTDTINSHLDKKKHVLLLFIDYSKAFDTLRHDQLIERLDATGIRGPLLDWCKDYLTDRGYRVKVGDATSDIVHVRMGTAQGSVIGPLHYLTYVNDAKNIIKNCQIYQFADDTCLIAADRKVEVAMQKLQEDFSALSMWSHDAGLVLNAEKTQLIHARSAHNPIGSSHVHLVAHNHDCLHKFKGAQCCGSCTNIEQVNKVKYLGLVVDDKFNWTLHVEMVCGKLRALLSKIFQLKHKVPFKILRNLYIALAESVIAYGITSYGRTNKTNLDKIYDLQIRLLKSIVPKKVKLRFRENYRALFDYCEILPVHEKVEYALLQEQFSRSPLQQFLYPITHNIPTRKVKRNDMATSTVPRTTNCYGRRTRQYIMPRLYNKLPGDLRESLNKKNAKQKLKQYYIQKIKNEF